MNAATQAGHGQGHHRLTTTQLVLRYGLFAVLATVANLGVQRLVLAIWPEATALFAAMFFGTGIGLVVKYLLDKRWIFFDMENGAKAHGKKFSLYTAMGLVTTAIFWGMETAGWLIWQTDLAREIGAVAGLAIGYLVKFHLDRRFVFQPIGPAERNTPSA